MLVPRTLGRIAATLLTLAVVAGLLVIGGPALSAAPAVVFGRPHEVSKLTLGNYSIDGPALWTSPTGAIRAELAWIGGGPDTGHHINLMTSGDGVHWGNKIILGERSPWSPTLTRYGPNASEDVVVAWTGANASHSLNVLVGNPPHGYAKLTFPHDNSFTSPGVALLDGDVYLVWAGTDASHTLNVARIIAGDGLRVGAHATLTGWHSIVRPSVVYDPNGHRLIMSWTSTDQRLHFATSTNGLRWTQPTGSPLAEWSQAGPMVFSTSASNIPHDCATWRGTNAAHSVNVRYTETFPTWPLDDAKGILPESAFGGPVMGSVGVSRRLIVAWTGTDARHHLNVAVVSV